MKKLCLSQLLRIRKKAHECVIKPFETDGCTAVPKGWFKKEDEMLKCCFKHDKAYWRGGTAQERKEADLMFLTCLKPLVNPFMAHLMYRLVRIFGWAYFPTPFRWGYGWPFLRGYKPLDEEELKHVKEHFE